MVSKPASRPILTFLTILELCIDHDSEVRLPLNPFLLEPLEFLELDEDDGRCFRTGLSVRVCLGMNALMDFVSDYPKTASQEKMLIFGRDNCKISHDVLPLFFLSLDSK